MYNIKQMIKITGDSYLLIFGKLNILIVIT